MLIKRTYALVDAAGFILQTQTREELEEGPSQPITEDGDWRLIDAPIDWGEQPSATSQIKWEGFDGPPVWVEMASLADVIAGVRDRIDAAGELLRQAVVNRRPLKGEEYAQAESQARAWKAAGYAEDPPRDVASWAAAKWRDGMTAREAADDILAQADQYRNLLSEIRSLRLARMEDARHAATTSEALAAEQEFSAELSNLMKGVS